MNDALAELKLRLAEIHDLERTLGVLSWDQRTTMPAKGAPARAEALATLGGIVHERFVSDEVGRLLERAEPLAAQLDYDSDDASLLRVVRRDWDKARRVPAELAAAWLRESSKAQAAWLEARAAVGLLALPAGVSARPRGRASLGRVPGGGRLALRRLPRRVRAGDEDRRGSRRLRRPPSGADGDRARRRRARRRLVPGRRLPGRGAAGVPRGGADAVRLRGGGVAARSDGAPVRDLVLAHRHPDDDALPAGQRARDLGGNARGRARTDVSGVRSRARADTARRQRVARARRVAEPASGRT